MFELSYKEKSIVSGCWFWCADGNKCFPWNEVNGLTEIDFGNLWCLEPNERGLYCARLICCAIPGIGKSYDGYTGPYLKWAL